MFRQVLYCIFIICQILALGQGEDIQETQVKECTDGGKKPSFVYIVGCKEEPCNLVLGEMAIAYVNFTADEQTDQLKVKALATPTLLPITVDYPLPQPDACKALTNTHCPLEVNEPAQYKLEMPIDPKFPTIELSLKIYLEVNGITNKQVTCFEVECTVVKKN